MSRDSHEVIDLRDPGIGDGHYPPQSDPNQASQGMSNFIDGSGPIFSMYLETAAEEDKKMAENWKADAEGILIFTGLFSAAVASLISVSIQDIRPNPQDTSNFYLANIYQTVADPNSSNISNPLPSSPPIFSPPNYAVWVNGLWFLSLVISLTCALLATLLQQWARRYLKVTQPRYSPHKRARIRAFFFEGVDKYLISWVVDALPSLLHVSLFLFFGGLVVFLCNVDLTIFGLVLSWVCFCTAIYGFITFIPTFCYNSPYSTPLTSLAWPTVTGTSFIVFRVLLWFGVRFGCSYETNYCFYDLAGRYRKLLVQGMQKAAEEMALDSPSEIDTRTFMWTFDSLDEDHELERFFFGLPGFCSSKVVDDPLPSLTEEQKEKFLDALIELSDRTFSSDLLPESVKSRRAAICAKALDPVGFRNARGRILSGIVRGDQHRGLQIAEFGRIVRGWGNSGSENIPSLAQATVFQILARALRRDDSWFTLASSELGIPQTVLRDYAAHGDSLSLALLVHFTRQQFIHYRESYWQEDDFALVLERTSKFDVQDTSPELQHEFCALWNQIVLKAQNNNDRFMAFDILGPISEVYTALHQGTDPASKRLTVTGNLVVVTDPSSYPLCSVAGHIHDDSASTTFAPIAAPASASLANPDPPSSSVPAPHRPDEGPMDMPPPDDDIYVPPSFHPSHHAPPETLRIPATSPDLATAGAIRDIVTSGTTMSHPTPETPASAPPLSSTSPPDVVAVPYIADHHTPSDGPNVPSPPSPTPVLDVMLHTCLQLSSDPPLAGSGCAPSPESHSSMLAPAAPFASPPRLTSAPHLGAAAGDEGNPKADLRKDKHTLDPSSTIHENIMAIPELPPQSPSPPSVTGVTTAGPSQHSRC